MQYAYMVYHFCTVDFFQFTRSILSIVLSLWLIFHGFTYTHLGTCRDQYDWLPRTDLEHEVEMEKVPFLQPVIDFVNFAGELVSTKVKYSIWVCFLVGQCFEFRHIVGQSDMRRK